MEKKWLHVYRKISAASYLLSASWIIEIKLEIQIINKYFYVKEDQYLFKNPYVIVSIAWVICSEQADPLLTFDLQGGYTRIRRLFFLDCRKAVATIFLLWLRCDYLPFLTTRYA